MATPTEWLVRTASSLLSVAGEPELGEEARRDIASFCAGDAAALLVCAVDRSPRPALRPDEQHASGSPLGVACPPWEGSTAKEEDASGEPDTQPADTSTHQDGHRTSSRSAAPADPVPTSPAASTAAADESAPSTATSAATAQLPLGPPSELHAFAGGSLPACYLAYPTVYFLRSGCQGPLEPLAAESVDSQVRYGLLPSGPSVSSLHQLSAVLVAWLEAQQRSSSGASHGQQVAADLLAAAAHKVMRQAEQAVKQLGTELELTLPVGVDLNQPATLASSEEAVLVCERCVVGWVQVVTAALQQEAQRQPQGHGPLAELQHWQRRAAVYGRLHEQLGLPAVQAVVEVVQRGSLDQGLLASFHTQASELGRVALEAQDNIKFLATLERHFNTIASGSLQAVADALPPMMSAIRMIWVISRYYGDDVRMSNLLERISHSLQDRLRASIHCGALFQGPAGEAIQRVSTCRDIAHGWQASYMQMRERIESSGHHARWEFSRGLLFEATNYAGEVCSELLGMLQAEDDLRQFLGPELKAVTGDTSVIDEVIVMLEAMVEPVQSVSFNVLDKAHGTDWRSIRGRFLRDAEDIKLATRDLIDTCFRKLRSVEAAVDLLHRFKRIRAHGAIQQQMQERLADVLEHFLKEIKATAKTFQEGMHSPPIARNMPPVAGAIKWSRDLFARVKRTMALLQRLDGDLASLDAGQRASSAYLDLARSMLEFEKACFKDWCTSEAAIMPALQQPLLLRKDLRPAVGSEAAPAPQAAHVAPNTTGDAAALAVNLSPQLLQLIREAKYLDRLGFAVPELAVSVALQEGRFHQQAESLAALLEHRRQVVAALSSAERALLSDHLASLDRALLPGVERLNWVSLAVPEFVGSATKAIEQFQALSAQVAKHASMIEKVVRAISSAQLLSLAPAAVGPAAGGQGGSVPTLQEFYEECEHARLGVVEGLVARYRSISALLLKVEEAVVGTSTGRAAKLAPYAAYWERRIFSALNQLVLNAMETLQTRLHGSARQSRGPLLRISLELLQPEVVVTPSMAEVGKQLSRLMRNLVDSSKSFVRWMDGTCVEAPEQFIYGEDSEPHVFTFFSDVSTSPAIIKAMLTANHAVQEATAAVARHAEGWRQYSVIWRTDRPGMLKRLAARRLQPWVLEERMARYQRLAEEMAAAAGDVEIGFVCVCPGPLAAALRSEAAAWADGVGSLGRQGDAAILAALRDKVTVLGEALGMQGEAGGRGAAAAAVRRTAPEADATCAVLLQHAETRIQLGAADAEAEEVESIWAVRRAWQELEACVDSAERTEQQQSTEAAAGGAGL